MPVSKPRRPVRIHRSPSASPPYRQGAPPARNARLASVVRIRVAQGPSAAASAGRHTKIRRRLGVSPGPVGFNGPVIEDSERRRWSPTRKKIVHAARVLPLDDGHANGLRARGKAEPHDRRGIAVEQTEPFAVQRELDGFVRADRRQAETGARAPIRRSYSASNGKTWGQECRRECRAADPRGDRLARGREGEGRWRWPG